MADLRREALRLLDANAIVTKRNSQLSKANYELLQRFHTQATGPLPPRQPALQPLPPALDPDLGASSSDESMQVEAAPVQAAVAQMSLCAPPRGAPFSFGINNQTTDTIADTSTMATPTTAPTTQPTLPPNGSELDAVDAVAGAVDDEQKQETN